MGSLSCKNGWRLSGRCCSLWYSPTFWICICIRCCCYCCRLRTSVEETSLGCTPPRSLRCFRSCKTWHEWNLTHIFLNWFKWYTMETSPRLFALNGVSVGPHLLQASTLEEMANNLRKEMMFFQVPITISYLFLVDFQRIFSLWCGVLPTNRTGGWFAFGGRRWCILCWVLIQCVSKQWTHLAPWKFKVSTGWFRWKVPKVVSPRRWGTVAMRFIFGFSTFFPKMMEFFYCEGVWAREKTKGWVSWIDCLSNDESEICSLFLAKSFVRGSMDSSFLQPDWW